MNLTINGVSHEVAGSELAPLLDVLRDELGVTGPKAGCHQGGCGSCTVLVDGEPRRSCLLPAGYADGTQITTVEGLGSPDDLSAATSAAAPGTRRSSTPWPRPRAATRST